MADNEVTQSGNEVEGDLIGRDKITTTFVSAPHTKSEYLKALYERFLLEEKENVVLKSYIADLDYYNSQVENDEMIGLELKLLAGNRGDFIGYAKEVKERFHKKLLIASQFSEVAQKINVYLLATVRSYYMTEIYPLICKGEDSIIINALINEKITRPLMVELGDNLFDFTPDDIHGMLYFLTGNCHIKWTE